MSLYWYNQVLFVAGGHHGHDGSAVGFTTTYAINAYHHYSCEFESCSWWGVIDTSCDKICKCGRSVVFSG
jgi:hypothetical protein